MVDFAKKFKGMNVKYLDTTPFLIPEQALQVGLEQKAKEFNEAGAEVYAKA